MPRSVAEFCIELRLLYETLGRNLVLTSQSSRSHSPVLQEAILLSVGSNMRQDGREKSSRPSIFDRSALLELLAKDIHSHFLGTLGALEASFPSASILVVRMT